MLVNSEYAKLIAIWMITQDNRGKKTAGVDGISELNPKQRLQMVSSIILNSKVSPLNMYEY